MLRCLVRFPRAALGLGLTKASYYAFLLSSPTLLSTHSFATASWKPYQGRNPGNRYEKPYQDRNPGNRYEKPYQDRKPGNRYEKPYQDRKPGNRYEKPYQDRKPGNRFEKPPKTKPKREDSSIGVYEEDVNGVPKLRVKIGDRAVCSVRDRKEGSKIYDIIATILKDKKKIPHNTKLNWEMTKRERPEEADNEERITTVLQWFTKKHPKVLYRGVSYSFPLALKGDSRCWVARNVITPGRIVYIGHYASGVQAALAYDTEIRDGILSKIQKLKKFNFRIEQDFITPAEALMPHYPLLGVYDNDSPRSLSPYRACQFYDRGLPSIIGDYDSPTEAAKAYDEIVLDIWKSKGDSNLLQPPTNFPPFYYNFEIQRPPQQ